MMSPTRYIQSTRERVVFKKSRTKSNQVAAKAGNGQALFNLDTCLFSKCHKIWIPLTKEVHRWGNGGVFECFLPGVTCSFQVFVKVV